MKSFVCHSIIFILCFSVSGCALLCQAGTATCGLSKEDADKLLHPKFYGEYWEKYGVSKEQWRQDWIACGGMKNGGYAIDGRLPAEKDDFSASERIANQLGSCMEKKGYTYQNIRL